MPLTSQLQLAIIAQVACGDKDLQKLLEDELALLYECQDIACTPRLKYLYTQLGAIELAQIFARNKIDQTQRVMAHVAQETFRATATRRTDAESTATGRVCQWAAATSQQHFVRDSTEDLTAFHESNLLRTAERQEDGFDLSYRSTNGSGFSFSRVIHTVEGRGGDALVEGAGQETRNSRRTSTTEGGTNALVPLAGTTWEFDIQFNPLSPPFITVQEPGPLYPINFPPGGDQICPEYDPQFPERRLCTAQGYNSMGQGYHGKYRLSIGVPPAGTLSLEWDRGFNERQYFHCSQSFVNGDSSVNGRLDTLNSATTTALPQDNRSASNESSLTRHYVRKTSFSTRRGLETVDAEETARGAADGNAHSESERNAKGSAFQQRRSESYTTADNESHLRRTEHLTDDDVRRNYGQISDHLAQMWKRIWDNIVVLEKELSAIPLGGAMNCPPSQLGCGCYGNFLPKSYYSRSPFLSLQSR